MGASRAYRHRYARYAAMPNSPYRFTRAHLFGPWTSSRVVWTATLLLLSDVGGCPVTHCPLAQPACLLVAFRGGFLPRLPFLSLASCSLAWLLSVSCPGLSHSGEDVDHPSFPILPPTWCFPLDLFPLYHYLEHLGFLGDVSFYLASLVCSLHSRL